MANAGILPSHHAQDVLGVDRLADDDHREDLVLAGLLVGRRRR